MLFAHLVLLSVSGWSPYDRFNEPDRSCDLRAALPGPGRTTLIGSTCNRLDGKPIGPLALLDATGHAANTPLAQALLTSVPDDRMRELSQLVALGDGWVVTLHKRDRDAPPVEGPHSVGVHLLLRIHADGTRDAAFEKAVQAALDSRLGASWGLLDVAANGTRLIVAAKATSTNSDYLKTAPVRVLRFEPSGKVSTELALDTVLAAQQLGYYEVLSVAPRPDGGIFVGGRFERLNHERGRLFVLAFDAQWKPDAKFNTPFAQKYFNEDGEVEIRLLLPAAAGAVWAIGEHDKEHVLRLLPNGTIDPSFKPYTLPGSYPQGRFLRPNQVAVGGDGALWVSFSMLPGNSPPWAGPGLVKLHSDGHVDAAFQSGLGRGVWYEPAMHGANTDDGGHMSLLAPQPDGAVIIAGMFDHVGPLPVKSPLRLKPDGSVDALWAPAFSTDVPAVKPEPNATTSTYFKADGKAHFIACKATSTRTVTYLYLLGDDGFGHTPFCAIHVGGDSAIPGGAWQHCDAAAKELEHKGATCTETTANPLHGSSEY